MANLKSMKMILPCQMLKFKKKMMKEQGYNVSKIQRKRNNKNLINKMFQPKMETRFNVKFY